ncbi:MAG: type II toxin-antitoxin system prevent-host-death family antitoxin [candidate division NC10 bacterium]|nr:type II toxin-antitoxin system prevent-host-death family antitoxin [candidate division NC10 bacterium]
MKERLIKVVPLSEARARLSQLVSEVEKGGSVAIARRSQIRAVLVSARWFAEAEEVLAQSHRRSPGRVLVLGNTAKLVGDLDSALREIQKEREASFNRMVEGLP